MLEIKMIEKTVKFTSNIEDFDPLNVPVGWVSHYDDILYSEDGSEPIGKAYGVNQAAYKRESDGHMIQYVTEHFLLPDGALVAEGPIDRERVIAMQEVSIPVKGISGLYLGMSGLWTWRIFDVTDKQIPLYSNLLLAP